MLAAFRAIMAGEPVGLEKPTLEDDSQKKNFLEASRKRWQYLASQLPAEDPGRLTAGRYWFVGRIKGGSVRKQSLSDLKDVLSNLRRYTGWPPFWVPTRAEIAPYPQDGAIECWLGKTSGDSGHADFWRISAEGSAFLMRGFQEDDLANDARRKLPPKQVLDLTVPVWRVAEILLRYNEFAKKVAEGDYTLDVSFGFEGLAGRRLIALNPNRMLFDNHVTKQDTYFVEALLSPQAIEKTLPETVDTLIRGLYELFDFFPLPASLPREEIEKMLTGRF